MATQLRTQERLRHTLYLRTRQRKPGLTLSLQKNGKAKFTLCINRSISDHDLSATQFLPALFSGMRGAAAPARGHDRHLKADYSLTVIYFKG